jgi:hypothetical protein
MSYILNEALLAFKTQGSQFSLFQYSLFLLKTQESGSLISNKYLYYFNQVGG